MREQDPFQCNLVSQASQLIATKHPGGGGGGLPRLLSSARVQRTTIQTIVVVAVVVVVVAYSSSGNSTASTLSWRESTREKSDSFHPESQNFILFLSL